MKRSSGSVCIFSSNVMNSSVVTIALVALIPSLVWCQCFTQNDSIKITADRLYDGQRKFSVVLLDALQKARPNESLFFSPHSTYRALLLTYLGANGKTEQSLKKLLNLEQSKSKADIWHAHEFEKRARQNRVRRQSIEFTSVDKLYVSEQIEVKKCFKEMLGENIEAMDFGAEPELSRNQINQFVERITRNNIKNLLPVGSIKTDTNAVLANAASFKGDWALKFDRENTKKKIFYEHGRLPVYVEMMKQKGDFNYGEIEELNTAYLELPYKGEHGSISMFILLPVFTANAIDVLLQKFTPEILEKILSAKTFEQVDVEFPKISFERRFKFVPILQQMGVGDLFDGTADLSDFSEKSLKFDDALHQAKIEIDENGTFATAATAFFQPGRTPLTGPKQFICNHPFIFLIHDQKSKEILFTGIYRGPNQ